MNTRHTAPQIIKRVKTAGSIVLLITITTLGSSCVSKDALETISGDPTVTYTTFTGRLWDVSSKENAIVEIPFSKMPEAALIEDGHTYTKDEERQMYYISGNPTVAQTHTTLRVIATPAAVAADVCLEGLFVIIYAVGSMGM